MSESVQLPKPVRLQMYLGPLDGHELQVSPETQQRVIERGFVKIRRMVRITHGGEMEVLELYKKGEDGKFRYMGRVRE